MLTINACEATEPVPSMIFLTDSFRLGPFTISLLVKSNKKLHDGQASWYCGTETSQHLFKAMSSMQCQKEATEARYGDLFPANVQEMIRWPD